MNIIYEVKNLISNKIYVGYYCGNNRSLDKMRPSNKEIVNDIKTLGKINFKYSLINKFETREETVIAYKKIITREFLLSENTYNNKCINRFTAKDKNGNTFYINKNDERYLNGELTPITKGKIVVQDKFDNFYSVKLDDPRFLSGEFFVQSKIKILVKDKNNNILYIKKENLNDNYTPFSYSTGIKCYYDNDGKIIKTDENDERVKNGSLKTKKEFFKPEKKVHKFVTNLQNRFNGLNLEFGKNDTYIINNYCKHNKQISIKRAKFKFIYKNKFDPKILCDKCFEEYMKSYNLSEKEYNDYIQILHNLKLTQHSSNYIKTKYPILYYYINKKSGKTFKEKIFLYKFNINQAPNCFIKDCSCLPDFSCISNKFNVYCKNHSYYNSLSSTEESELFNFIESIYDKKIIRNTRKFKKELDIYIPEKNLAIEYNGIYWHTNVHVLKTYHYNKWKLCKDNNIQLITIWSDDWYNKKNIIKNIISNKLNVITNKIYARKCIIKEVNFKDKSLFLNENHLQGDCISSINLGLYYKNELVSLMTFGKKRKITNSYTNNNEYEMLRFCSKLNISVIGGASKLFKYFINTYNPKSITSYANCDISDGHLYKTLGFKFIKHTGINYWWVKNNKKYHRSNFMKYKLIKEGYDKNKTENEIMLERKYSKMYGTGNLKFIYE